MTELAVRLSSSMRARVSSTPVAAKNKITTEGGGRGRRQRAHHGRTEGWSHLGQWVDGIHRARLCPSEE